MDDYALRIEFFLIAYDAFKKISIRLWFITSLTLVHVLRTSANVMLVFVRKVIATTELDDGETCRFEKTLQSSTQKAVDNWI